MKERIHRRLTFFLLLLLFIAPWFMGATRCGGQIRGKGKLSYTASAKQLYLRGIKYLKASNFEYARKSFQRLKTTFPFSHYATLAEVGIADSYFLDGRYLQAIDAYKIFEKLHPTHPKTPHAVYRIAVSYYKLRPWEIFFLPAPYETDATTTKQAIYALKDYLRRYPKHTSVKTARKYLKICIRQLAKHELHVADFYEKKGKFNGVAWRMAYLIQHYPESDYVPTAYARMIRAYLRLKNKKKAQEIFKKFKEKYPKNPYIASLQKELENFKESPKKKPSKKLHPPIQPPQHPKKLQPQKPPRTIPS